MIEVVASRALTPKHQLLVVRIGERALILGVSPDRVDKITELTDPHEVIPMASPPDFQEELQERQADYLDPPGHAGAQPDLGPYQREIERLKKMVSNWRLAVSRGGSK